MSNYANQRGLNEYKKFESSEKWAKVKHNRGKIMSQRANKLQRPFWPIQFTAVTQFQRRQKLQQDMNKQLQAPKPVDNDLIVKSKFPFLATLFIYE